MVHARNPRDSRTGLDRLYHGPLRVLATPPEFIGSMVVFYVPMLVTGNDTRSLGRHLGRIDRHPRIRVQTRPVRPRYVRPYRREPRGVVAQA